MSSQAGEEHHFLGAQFFESRWVLGLSGDYLHSPHKVFVPVTPGTRRTPPQEELLLDQMLKDVDLWTEVKGLDALVPL